MNVQEILERLSKVQRISNGWSARCPAHSDNKNSLNISVGSDGRVLMKCHAGCSTEEIMSTLGLQMRDLFPDAQADDTNKKSVRAKRIVAIYDYCDEGGELLFQALRYEPKDFRQRRPNGKGRYAWSLDGIRRVLYRLPELIATEISTPIFIVEGEKDVDRLRELGFVATTNIGGAGKWRDEYNEFLRGRPVIILPDNDDVGRKHANQVAKSLVDIASSVKVIDLPSLPPKGDVSDWLDTGGTPNELLEIAESARVHEPAADDRPLFKWATTADIISAADLLCREFPEPKYAVEGIVQEGVNILAGAPKMGKSWLGLNIAVAVASGGYVLGTVKVDEGDVLYLALEDGARRLQSRLRAVLNSEPAPARLRLATDWPTFDNGGLDKIEMWLDANAGARLIVIDTLKRIRPQERNTNNIYGQDYDALAPLSDIANKRGVCILVVHHTRKAQSDDPLDLVSGSTGLTGAADAILVLKRARNSSEASLFITGRDVEERDLALRWDAAITAWRLLGNADEHRVSAERREIIDLLVGAGKPLSPQKVAETLGRDRNTIKQLMWRMGQDGQLRNDGQRSYRVAITDNPDNRDNLDNIGELFGYPVTAVTGYSDEQSTIQ